MIKKDIVAKISEKLDMKQVDVKEVVQKTFDAIISSLASGEDVELRNFGNFKVRKRKERYGRNPKTGEKIKLREKKVVSFKPGCFMKERVK